MPTISVEKDAFFKDLGKKYTHDEFETLMFDYGLELDEDTSISEPQVLPHKLKIEVPANRYDLLCHEGLARALNIYLEREDRPKYRLKEPEKGKEWVVEVSAEVAKIRPYFSGAILRGVKFDERRYASFIDLQDKLHGNLARKRSLVAIGTHDLNKIVRGDGVIRYKALPPKQIHFVPLNKDKEYTAEELMTLYESDRHLSRYLHIIRDSPVYPIIYDSSDGVLSMPPIINSERTKITLETTDVFIDMTAVDETKLDVVMNMVVTMFGQYCSDPFAVEPVKVVYTSGKTCTTPNLEPVLFEVSTSYINSALGLSLSASETIKYLQKMGHEATSADGKLIKVLVPPTRSDILQECDLMEDVAVAYGFNKLVKTFPATNTVGVPFPINKLSDTVRRECAYSGWLEVAPLILCSRDENFAFLNRTDDGKTAVVLENPKTEEYQVVRTSLLPGILKTVRENKKHALPFRVFEVSDVAVKDETQERRSRNIRRVAAVYCGLKAGFENVHGLLDRIMAMLEVKRLSSEKDAGDAGYYIKEFDNPTYFPNRGAKIYYRHGPPRKDASINSVSTSVVDSVATSKDASSKPIASLPASTPSSTSAAGAGALDTLKETLSAALPLLSKTVHGDVEIGSLGILHPSVLGNFELSFPCSALEFDLEPFLLPEQPLPEAARR